MANYLPFVMIVGCAGLAAALAQNNAPPADLGKNTSNDKSEKTPQKAPANTLPSGQQTPASDQPAAKQTAPNSGSIKYSELVSKAIKPKLPYGRPFTVTGKVSEVCIKGTFSTADAQKPCGDGGQTLKDVIAPTTVGGSYIANGIETPFTPLEIAGDDWTVTIGKLDENTSVIFKFAFTGNLSADHAMAIIDEMLANTNYTSSLEAFITSAQKTPAQTTVLAGAFGQTTATFVLELLKKHGVSPKDPADLGKRLFSPSAQVFATFINLPDELNVLRNLPGLAGLLGLKSETPASEIYKKIVDGIKNDVFQKIANAALQAPARQQAQTFVTNYEALRKELASAVIVSLTVQVGTTADDITQDLQKYAGFDGGALYVPRLHELRSFATVNIYFGPVSLHPSVGDRSQFWERVSLTFGIAPHDLSGGDANKSKVKDQNAFIYGMGVRLNKYFRLTTGGIVYRAKLPAVNGIDSALSNKLRHELYIGPSIDITAIPALQNIFAKSKSN